MAVLSDYSDGTISIAANGVVATGTGTAFNLQAFQEGDTLLVNNLTAVLSGPATSSTSIPLTRPWTGGVVTNAPYRIRYMSDGSRYTAIAQALVNLLGDGTIAAMAAVGSGVDKLTYWVGAGVAGLTDITTFGRSILAAADINAILPNRLNPSSFAVTDFDALTENGWFRGAGGATGNPTGSFGQILHLSYDAATAWQRFIGGNSRSVWERQKISNVWQSWAPVGNPTIGTVSQSSGIPTGAIIERGSNANGDYVRFADGTQICWFGGMATGPVTTASGTLFINDSGAIVWTFPVGFPGGTPILSTGGNASSGRFVNPTTATSSVGNFRIFGTVSAFATNAFAVMAVGRWF